MTSISLSPDVDVLVVTEVGLLEKKAIYEKVSQSLVKRIPLQTILCVNITIPTLSNYFAPSQFFDIASQACCWTRINQVSHGFIAYRGTIFTFGYFVDCKWPRLNSRQRIDR